MKWQPVTKTTELYKVTVGSALIAQPFQSEEIYKRTVILITRHDENGTQGIIINKTSDTTIHVAFPGIPAEYSVYFGGPLSYKTMTFIHCHACIPGSAYLAHGISIGGKAERIQQMIKQDKLDLEKIKFCAGIVRWKAGELNEELLQNIWWLSKITCRDVFALPPEILWSTMLLQMHNLYGFTAHLPDPSAN
jgi:putative transcriptional regulator